MFPPDKRRHLCMVPAVEVKHCHECVLPLLLFWAGAMVSCAGTPNEDCKGPINWRGRKQWEREGEITHNFSSTGHCKQYNTFSSIFVAKNHILRNKHPLATYSYVSRLISGSFEVMIRSVLLAVARTAFPQTLQTDQSSLSNTFLSSVAITGPWKLRLVQYVYSLVALNGEPVL